MSLTCESCGVQRNLSCESEAIRLGRTKCQPCGRREGKKKKSKLAEHFSEYRIFGELSVLKLIPSGGRVVCRCSCGIIVQVDTRKLLNGVLTRCRKCSIGCFSPLWKGAGSMPSSYYSGIKKKAMLRGMVFNVSAQYLSEVFDAQQGKCALTGIDLHFSAQSQRNLSDDVASLDRIDSSRGYEEGNVQWVHKYINIMKLDHSQDYFIRMCKLVATKHTDSTLEE